MFDFDVVTIQNFVCDDDMLSISNAQQIAVTTHAAQMLVTTLLVFQVHIWLSSKPTGGIPNIFFQCSIIFSSKLTTKRLLLK